MSPRALPEITPQKTRAALACAVLAMLAGACSSDKGAPASAQGAPAQAAATAETPKFGVPANTSQSPPDINSVPTQAPTPPSTKDEREKAAAGLVADRANARYSDQPARTMPVAVRPLVDTPGSPAPPATLQAAVDRLSDAPPARPADAGSDTATPAAPAEPALPAAGPVGPGRATAALIGPRRVPAPVAASNSDDDDSTPRQASAPAGANGYRTLQEFDSTVYGSGHLLATLDFPAGSLSASERAEIGTAAAKQQQTRGVVRVIGHGPTKTSSADRATTVARELERLGVPKDQIFTGSETSTGPTEVFVHY